MTGTEAKAIREIAIQIIRVDGDRDPTAGSNMTCEQTQLVAKLLLELADMQK